MRAAAGVGYAATPLLLFYALSQAGRAISAALADDPWELTAHGLKHELREPTFRSIARPDPNRAGTDIYSRVTRALSQEPLAAPVELVALGASLPDLHDAEASSGA
jgi:hypothetical protein